MTGARRGFPRCDRRPRTRRVGAVRFVVELDMDQDGRVSGQVAAAGSPSTPFSGWLELLRLLEDRADDTTERAQPVPGDGLDQQERR